MKFLAWLVASIAVVLGAVYTLLFTSLGNALIKPLIETEIQKQTHLPSHLQRFSMGFSDIDIVLELNPKNTIAIKGSYSLFSQSFDLFYEVKLRKLSTLQSLTQKKLNDSFFTDGEVKGNLQSLSVNGKSNVSKSNTTYSVQLDDFQATSIIANVKGLDLPSLLHMLGEKRYAEGRLDVNVNFKNITPHKLDGDILLLTKEALLNSAVLKKDFGIVIPKTRFSMNLDAKLKGDDVDYRYFLKSNLAKISSSGKIKPEPLALAIKYGVDIQELALLKPIIGADIRGKLRLSGTVNGSKEKMNVQGRSDIAGSKTTFSAMLHDFKPKSIEAKIKDLQLQKLLYMLKQPHYADALFNLDVAISNADVKNLQGTIKSHIDKGIVNSKYFTKAYKLKKALPKTDFSMDLNAKLSGGQIDYTTIINSNLAKITSSGDVKAEPLALDVKYALNMKELALLNPIINAKLRGPLKMSGSLKGDKTHMRLLASSDVAASETNFAVNLEEFQPKSAKFSMKHLKLQKLLYMVNQPHYTDGLVTIDGDIQNADMKNLQGTIKTRVTQGLLDSKYLTKAYKFKYRMPQTKFTLSADTKLNKKLVDTKLSLSSTLAELTNKQIRFNIDDASLQSDYRVKIKDLNKLYFVTERHLKGSFIANGELKKAKDLDFTMHSDIADGKVDAKLHNDDFHADIKGLQTLDILDMLIYPKIVKAKIDAKMDYNLATSKGVFKGYLSEGMFTRNQVLDLTKQYAHIDLYKQKFKGDVDANINKENILASLDLKSNTSSIVTKNTYINSKTKRIKSVIDINANGNPLVIKLSGNIEKPKIQVDASKIIQKEANKAVKKEIEKHLGKEVGNLLKGLF